MSLPPVSCQNCGEPISGGNTSCPNCGEEVFPEAAPTQTGRSLRAAPDEPEPPTARGDFEEAPPTARTQPRISEAKTARLNQTAGRTRQALGPQFLDFRPAITFLGEAANPPVALSLYFPNVLLAGARAKIWAKVENRGGQLIQNISVGLESSGMEGNLFETVAELQPGEDVTILFDSLMPASAGVFVLACSIEFGSGESREKMAGARTLWVNARPEKTETPHGIHLESFAVNSTDGKIPEGRIRPKLLGEEAGAFVLEQADKSAEDLAGFRLEEFYHPLALAYLPSIPEAFLNSAERGTCLELSPADTSAMPIHLVARNEFKIGRARRQSEAEIWADLVVWFLPRNPANDEKTRSLGRLHVIAEARDNRVTFKNYKPEQLSFLDNNPLGGEPVPLLGRTASLTLSDYNLDVLRFAGLEGSTLKIRNLENWKGDLRTEPAMRGAVAFRPVGRRLPFHEAIWVLSSASFGSDPTCNAIIHPQLAPSQGCIYYYHGCFWLQNLVANEKVQINGQPALPDQIFPLSGQDRLTFGGTEFALGILD